MTKDALYEEAAKEIEAVLDGETNAIARMTTLANILHHKFEHFFWTGFYIVDQEKDSELFVGPYQGTMGCLRIPFGRGVCGTAAQTGETQIVEDVHAFAGHISCDPNSNSEIVVPVYDKNNALIAVFDVDSTDHGAFDATDARWLEKILASTFTL